MCLWLKNTIIRKRGWEGVKKKKKNNHLPEQFGVFFFLFLFLSLDLREKMVLADLGCWW